MELIAAAELNDLFYLTTYKIQGKNDKVVTRCSFSTIIKVLRSHSGIESL